MACRKSRGSVSNTTLTLILTKKIIKLSKTHQSPIMYSCLLTKWRTNTQRRRRDTLPIGTKKMISRSDPPPSQQYSCRQEVKCTSLINSTGRFEEVKRSQVDH